MAMEKHIKEMLDFLYEGIYFVDNERTIISWNKGAENITGFSAAEVVGKKCYENILNHVDSIGNQLCHIDCPLHATMADGVPREARVFLQHKKGHRLPVAIKTMPMYGENDEVIGAVEIFLDDRNKVQILNSLEKFKKEATEDPLTGLPNRRFILTVLESRLHEYKELEIPFGVAFIDIDNFKKVNDDYGHDIGDEILKLVAETLDANMRKQDVVCRWGGEEFIIVFSNVDAEGIKSAGEKMRVLVEKSKLRTDKEELSVTISIGITIAGPEDTIDSVISNADKLMYESKQAGRNQVTFG